MLNTPLSGISAHVKRLRLDLYPDDSYGLYDIVGDRLWRIYLFVGHREYEIDDPHEMPDEFFEDYEADRVPDSNDRFLVVPIGVQDWHSYIQLAVRSRSSLGYTGGFAVLDREHPDARRLPPDGLIDILESEIELINCWLSGGVYHGRLVYEKECHACGNTFDEDVEEGGFVVFMNPMWSVKKALVVSGIMPYLQQHGLFDIHDAVSKGYFAVRELDHSGRLWRELEV